MKKLLIILLLTIPFVGFGQTIELFHKRESVIIDVQKDIKVEYVSFTGRTWLDYGIKKDNGKPNKGKIKKKSKILDEGNLIKFRSRNDVINFMTKFGFSYEGSDTKSGSIPNTYTGTSTSYSITYLTFKNNNN